ncbi:hypothetical protein ACFU5O_13920 [Streptomyces sp. NPDC057445]|uniref:SbtR family transcriptional regulator n=1 Tax=Streptomyces sp. NPDC057445 TaxID=3346136 RepID=UPI0036B76298
MNRHRQYHRRRRQQSDEAGRVGRDQVDAAVAALLSATVVAGITRPDVAPDDVVVALSGIAMVADVLEDRDQVSRVLDLLFEGIRTRP